ncbi:glucosamine 6-phosphate N-acetyltransferase-like [Clytia hemisphaerica]|uniref:Glucosamine 6-phosphate N-acetyltransferase n=1 Tax=Clytia hemisphaerica TaxID=252671 RepID=A0A7M5WVX9_9CNID
MKAFDQETFENILSSKGVKIADYVQKRDAEDEDLILRPLEVNDHTKGYLELIFDDVETADNNERERVFEEYLSLQDTCPGTYYTIVVEDLNRNKIIASGTLIVEQKFIHEIALRGRIENMIVDQEHRRRKIGSVVLGLLTFLAEKLGCYKTTLNCTDDVALFCEKMKYMHEAGQNFMLCHVTPTVINPDHENTSRL